MLEVGDVVRYKGERVKILEIANTPTYGPIEYYVEYINVWQHGAYVTSDEITFIHKKKPADKERCECGGWGDAIENHYDWCPMYTTWNWRRNRD